MKSISVLFVTLFLFGCTTFGSIHGSIPIKTLTVEGKSPEKLANCVLYEAKTRGFNAVLSEKQPDYLLFLSRTYINDIPFGEITFKPQVAGTLIEIRAFNGYGVRESWPLECVMPCATPQNNPGK
jgi:hypothetical protein